LKIMVLDRLRKSNRILIDDLAKSIGVSNDQLNPVIDALSRNYLVEKHGKLVVWNPADNPSMLKPWGWNLIHEIVLGSTMDYARGCGLWNLVVAEYQLTGRGRHGKRWISNFGGLWTTFKLPIKHENAGYIPVVIPVMLTNILSKYYGVEASIKWPNDIVYNELKLAGFLVEAEASHDRVVLYIGIGINVNNNPPLPGSISLRSITGRMIPRNGLLSLIISGISRLEKMLDEPEYYVELYMNKLITLDRRVRIVTINNDIVEGRVTGIEENGDLIVDVNGLKKVFSSSEVFELIHID